MAHEIEVLDSGVVKVTHSGRMTIVEASASRTEAAAIMKELGLVLILADVSQTDHDETTTDLYEFNSSHYDVFPPRSRLAVVIPPVPEQAASARFAETVALNRGIRMKIFLTCDEALMWLTAAAGD
jgi:hypothetical protein